ncbi:DNA-directed RNA polymerase subunit D [Candidatus Micrarchaeota archaeon]|nr:DNA-directed RNA polymerase subunit D [Candidatus Micrarchaeota archaeon]
MKVETIKSSEEELELVISGVACSFANALRRVGMSQVPVFAVDSITVYENSSAFFDEYIANRLALVPLRTEEGYKEGEEIILMLDAVGPCTVYSKDLRSTDGKITPAREKIPLLKLGQGQNVRLEAKAKLGIGREHAKFQASNIMYNYDEKKDEYAFKIESFGQMAAREVLKQAVKVINEKCKELEKQMKK